MSINEKRSEKLIPGADNYKHNDPYKVCYRFLANLCSQWKALDLKSFPTVGEAITIARLADPYFVWLFDEDDKLWQYTNLYEFMEDVWND